MTPLLVRVDDLTNQTSTQYAYARSPVRVGRNALNDLALEFKFVSQWHAVVQFDDQNTMYFDLGSTNGTTVNGQRLGKNVPVPISPNTEFRIGNLRIYFARGPAPAHLLQQKAPNLSGTGFGASMSDEAMSASLGDRSDRTMMFDVAPTSAYDPKTAGSLVAAAQAMGNPSQMRSIAKQVQPAYDAYRRAWTSLFKSMGDAMRAVPPDQIRATMSFLEKEMPAISNEDEYRQLATAHQVPPSGPHATAHAAGTLVAQMAQYFVPSTKPPENPGEVEKMLVRIASVLDAFGNSYVALRKGYNQFGSEMALPHNAQLTERTPISVAGDPREVLSYLLDWNTDPYARVQELTSAYADIMIHQVALLNGLMEGVRSLLQRMGPDAISREADHLPVKLGPLKIPSGMWPFKASARWRRYVERHRELTEEDREITSAVFGNEFARAYAGVVGENFTESGPKRLNDGTRR